ncbi:MAG: AMP-binding protein [Pseudomonadota bacterium]|nr:AMP-binding protein [Pseudomonadota bacterium]
MKKIWLDHYPSGIPATIDASRFESVVEVFSETCERYSDRPAFSNMGTTIDYRQLDALSLRFAAYLQQGLGLEPGDRVALMMPNLLQYPVCLFGILRAGLIAVPVNPLYTASELRHQLHDSGAIAIVVLENHAAVLAEALPHTRVRHVIISRIGDLLGFPKGLVTDLVVRHVKKLVRDYRVPGALSLRQALSKSRRYSLEAPEIGPDDLCFLQYTGGTTGVAKGAMLTHGNMVANMLQVSTWFSRYMIPGEEIIVSPLPLYHIFCLSVNCLSYMSLGGLNVLITNPRDIPAFVTELSRWKFTAITGVNTLYNVLLHDDAFTRLDFSRLKLAVGGGMAVQKAVADRWQAVTGVAILEGYGLTETAPVVTANPPGITEFSGSIGLPIPSTEISVRDDDGTEVSMGEPGELWVRGPQVMKGYWQQEEETAKAFADGDWFRTGDIATVDETGRVRIVDRIKDMILVSGFNVYPNEIEETLAAHPAVLESACVGVADEKSGEAVRAFIVLRPGHEVSEDALRAHCRKTLAAYKIPRDCVFRDALPKTNVGKILRRGLREGGGRE